MTYLTTVPVVRRSRDICGMHGTNEPITNTIHDSRRNGVSQPGLYVRASEIMDVHGIIPESETRARIIRFRPGVKRS